MIHEEVVPGGRVIWQSEKAKTYLCPVCWRPVFSQYEGDAVPTITCDPGMPGSHRLQWGLSCSGEGNDA